MSEKNRETYGYRSLFWPIILIGGGVIALLANMGLVQGINLFALLKLWPLLLVLAGLDIMLARTSPALGAVLGIAVVGGVVALLVASPALADTPGFEFLTFTDEIKSETFIDDASANSMSVELELRNGPTTIRPLTDSNNLFVADVKYMGELAFETGGSGNRRIYLGSPDGYVNFGSLSDDVKSEDLPWTVGIAPDIPLDLTVDVGNGSGNFDLSRFPLTSLFIDGGNGNVQAELGDSVAADVRLDLANGGMTIDVGTDANLEIEVDGGNGTLKLNVPADAAVQVIVEDDGNGDLRLPNDFERTRGSGDDDEGTWETANFVNADYQIIVTVDDLSNGDVVIGEIR